VYYLGGKMPANLKEEKELKDMNLFPKFVHRARLIKFFSSQYSYSKSAPIVHIDEPFFAFYLALFVSCFLQVALNFTAFFLCQDTIDVLLPSKVVPTLVKQAFVSPVVWGYLLRGLAGHLLLLIMVAILCAYLTVYLKTITKKVGFGASLAISNTLCFVLPLSLNTIYFPHSKVILPSISQAMIFFVISGILISFFLVGGIMKNIREGAFKIVIIPFALTGLFVWFATPISLPEKTIMGQEKSKSPRPNLILIGIDSLRPDETVILNPTSEITPYINQFLNKAVVFPDSYTPLARTFPAWVSIMTGEYPWRVGVPFNLTKPESKAYALSIPGLLQKKGYWTVYATDEKRFSNIDSKFGFDQVIGPIMGAADFLFGSLNDTYLGNLFINGRFGKWFFPFSHANRAAFVTYSPKTFVRLIGGELKHSPSASSLLCVHLCLPHYPYIWKDAPVAKDNDNDARNAYRNTLRAVDLQFHDLLNLLENQGYLENALVAVFSDHGETFGDETPIDNISPPSSKTEGQPSKLAFWGHGTAVLSENQYHVVLGFRKYGNNNWQSGIRNTTAILSDILPTLLNAAGISLISSKTRAGISLLPAIEKKIVMGRHPFFRTTGLNPKGVHITTGSPTAEDIQAGMQLYKINPHTGRLLLKLNVIKRLKKEQEWAVSTAGTLLAELPTRKEGTYAIGIRQKSHGRIRILNSPKQITAANRKLFQLLEKERKYQ
jgi:hypothetical protein